jgi:uroporphyrinogen-III synthase
MIKKSIIFFRSGDLPPDFESSLSEKYIFHSIPVLSFSFEEFQQNLNSPFLSSSECVVFPSPRSVEAVKRASISLENKLICAVGESTASLLESCLNLRPWLTGSQGAESLAQQIISSNSVKTLAYLSGDNQATFPLSTFEFAGIDAREVTCYGTREVSLSEINTQLSSIPIPDICVFFSPSGAKTVKKHLPWPWEAISLISIGSTTQDSVLSLFGKSDGIPSEFNLTGLKSLLLSLT